MNIEPRDTLIGLSVYYKGDWGRIFSSLRQHSLPPDEELSDLLRTVKSKAVTILDPEYPSYIRLGCIRPPFVLFYYGDIALLQNPDRILTVVGSRDPASYSSSTTRELCKEMVSRDYVLASGLARGIDTVVGEEGARSPGHAIAVLGCGIERSYPLENTPLRDRIASTGLLISEYPGDTPPESRNFPMRNRILASIGKCTFASEVGVHSGTMITVGYALHMGHDVGVLPFQVDERYCNNTLIKSGAALVENAEDLVLMMQGRAHFGGNFL